MGPLVPTGLALEAAVSGMSVWTRLAPQVTSSWKNLPSESSHLIGYET